MKDKDDKLRLIERGDIYFFYRPHVHARGEKEKSPQSIRAIHRVYIVLHAHEGKKYRLFIVGKKRLPQVEKHEKAWLTVEKVSTQSKAFSSELKEINYVTKTRGERSLPSARPCAEGVYCILKDERQTYLSYRLQFPKQLKEVQKTLHIPLEASYVFSVKNQSISGTQSGKLAKFPKRLNDQFHHLRFAAIDPPDFMNYPGAELLLVAVNGHTQEKARQMIKSIKQENSADKIFRDLKLEKNKQSTKPLFKGEWQ